MAAPQTRHRRSGVSAPTVNADKFSSWSAPLYPKNHQERYEISEALKQLKLLFGHLRRNELNKVIDAFFRDSYSAGAEIIRQGDEGSNFYVIASGSVGFYVARNQGMTPQEVGKAGKGGSFGELALLYGSPRAATVIALEKTELWALDRETFQLMITTAENTKKRIYEEFIENIDIFKGLNRYEIVNLCDMLTPEIYCPGEYILHQGDRGDRFYIMEKGEACAMVQSSHEEEIVQEYSRGGYFGELALMGDGQRRASVYAITRCNLLSIDKATFDRVLGPLLDAFRLKARNYREVK